jgi:hypothetical protein
MSYSKELFLSIREEEIQDVIFIEADREEQYISLQEERKEEIGKIIVVETEKSNVLPF